MSAIFSRQRIDVENDGNLGNIEDISIPASGSSSAQSKHNPKISFDLSLEHMKCDNEIDWTFMFNFVFHFTESSSNQINESGVNELALPSTSQLKVRIQGSTSSDDNVAEFHVNLGEIGECNRIQFSI